MESLLPLHGYWGSNSSHWSPGKSFHSLDTLPHSPQGLFPCFKWSAGFLRVNGPCHRTRCSELHMGKFPASELHPRPLWTFLVFVFFFFFFFFALLHICVHECMPQPIGVRQRTICWSQLFLPLATDLVASSFTHSHLSGPRLTFSVFTF